MKTFRTALLVAAALAIVPAAAHAEDRFDRHGHGERGDRGGDGGDRVRGDARPAPPQAQTMQASPPRTSVLMPPRASNDAPPPPRANWGGGQPGFQQPQQRPERGVWPGGGAWRGDRGGEWRQRPDASPTPPQAVTGGAPQAGLPSQTWDNRNQWGRDGRDRDHRTGDRHDRDSRWDNRERGVWPGGDRRWDNDHRQDNDHRWDNNRRGDNDHRWDNNRRWDNDRRWDPSRWRNDHRYDWRGWRNDHHDLFRWRYYAPRGYHYRPVYRGFYLEPFFYGSSYWLADPFEYRLPPVEWPLRWVRYYNDALLVDVTTGEVVDIIQEFFW